nr:putative ribonuclease H-like domain-containing protein [Tanacetum cinerariifolium]
KKFGFSDVRSSNTPMDKENPWRKDGTGKDYKKTASSSNTPMDKENPWGKDEIRKDVDLHLYRSVIGSLMYLTASRPDIMFAVCACARHQVTPKECHLHAVKRIFRYLKGHPKLGLWYPKESPFDLVAYSDSDYSGATQDRKSTTGGCQFLGRRLISWQCKKQTIVATSTTKVEYVAAASCCGQVLWIQNQLLDYGYNSMNTNIYIDNNSAICIVKNHVYHSKTKHIKIRHHFIRDCFEKKLINVDHIHTDENVADLLTKPFDAGRFQYLVVEHAMRGFVKGILNIYTSFVSHIVLGWVIETFKYWGVLRILMISLRLIPLVSNGYVTMKALANMCINFLLGSDSEQRTHEFIHIYLASASVARNAQSSTLPDEPASPQRDVSQGEACPTDSGFIADQDRATIDKSFTLPYDSAPRVTSPAADEGKLTDKFQAQEVEINRLKERVKMLEDREGVAATRSKDDAPIKGRSINEGEAATERISDDSEEMATVLTSMDVATVLASGVVDIPTGSGSIPTASTPAEEQVPTSSDVVPTASPIFTLATVVTPYRRRKGKEVMVESETLKKQNVQEQIDAQIARELEEQLEREDYRGSEQIARYAEIARIHVEEELQIMIDGLDRNNKTIEGGVSKISKEEAAWLKRKGIRLEKEEVKKMKTSEEVSEEVKSSEEVSKEKIKEMIQLVPIEEVYVEALQVKHPIIDWKVHIEGHRAYWEITSLVKETLNNRPLSSDKEMELWVELNRLYEPDNEDQLGEGVPSKEGSSTCDDQLQALSGELLTDEAKFKIVWEQIEGGVSKISKEEAAWLKRKGIRLEKEEVKKMKTSEEVSEEVKSSEEVSKEKIKEMIQLVPIEEVYVEALQVKHPIIDWKVHIEGHRAYWEITSLVKETLNNRPLSSDKEMELWVELNRLYEPDNEDQLWTHTQNFMHAPVEWKLYDTCGVHHVTSKDKKIFMLVEKEYPLRKGLALVMISYKL